MIIKIDPYKPDNKKVQNIVSAFNMGAVVSYPTDTIYGIGCDVKNEVSVNKIYDIKGRVKNNPLSIICKDLNSIKDYALVNDKTFKILNKFLPGPYTFILNIKDKIYSLNNTYSTVGVRIPDIAFTRILLESLNYPIITTSANRSGEKPINNPELIYNKFGKEIDLLIDGGVLNSEPSTIVDLSKSEPNVLRKGKGYFNI